MVGGPTRLWAGCFALSAFIVAIGSGLAADNPALTVLVRALIAMILCYPVGLLVGGLCTRIVEWHREAQPEAGAIPSPDDAVSEEPKVPGPAGDREAGVFGEQEAMTA